MGAVRRFADEEVFFIDILPPWEIYFDGVARQDSAGAEIVLILPERHILTYSFTLNNLCSNNVTEYQALVMGLKMVIDIGVKDNDMYGDSKLVINQLLDEYEVRKDDLLPLHRHALKLLDKLETVKLEHIPRSANKMADTLTNLVATLALGHKKSL